MTDPRELLDVIAQRAECTQHLGGWERHNAAQCSEFTHQEAPKLVAALRAVLDILCDVELDASGCYGARPPKLTPPKALVPRLRSAITEALGGTQ